MRLFKYLIIVILLSSCSSEETYTSYSCVCSKEQREKAALFVQNSIKNTNNMSDEKMEDVILELRKTSVMLYCSQRNITYTQDGSHRKLITPLDSNEIVIF